MSDVIDLGGIDTVGVDLGGIDTVGCVGWKNKDTSTQTTTADGKITICFVDGVSGVGKTTMCDLTVDFTRLCNARPIYKKNKSYLSFVYTMHIMRIIMNCQETISASASDEPFYIDRSPCCHVVYRLLYEHKGMSVPLYEFRKSVDPVLLEIEEAVRESIVTWVSIMKRLFMKKLGEDFCEIRMIWAVPKNIERTTDILKRRGTFESTTDGWVPKYWVENQAYLFEYIAGLGIGDKVLVDDYLTKELVKSIF